jgi:tetratricopeptide (TPR) repeat protein
LLGDSVELADDAADADACRRAIEAGELGACRRRLWEGRFSPPARARLYCRLGEALFYREQRAAAADCARAGFALQPEDPSTADFCAWLFSNCRRYAEAAAAYERLLEWRPGWAAGHRHASGALARRRRA